MVEDDEGAEQEGAEQEGAEQEGAETPRRAREEAAVFEKTIQEVKDTFVNLRSPLLSMIDLARKQDTLQSEFEEIDLTIKQSEKFGSPNPKLCEKLADQKNNLVMLQRDKEKVQSDIRNLLDLIENLTYPRAEHHSLVLNFKLEVKRMKYMPEATRDDSPLSELLCVSNPMRFKDWLIVPEALDSQSCPLKLELELE